MSTLLSIAESLLLAASLCADCFAVSTRSSVTLRSVSWRSVVPIAIVFGVVQTTLMALGWMFGDIFVGHVQRISSLIGFLLLLYVGGSMMLQAVRNKVDAHDLNGLRNVVIGAVATSIDAFAVGVSLSMGSVPSAKMVMNLSAVFCVTILSVTGGMFGGQKIGRRFGRPAEIVGGGVLMLIGLGVLLKV